MGTKNQNDKKSGPLILLTMNLREATPFRTPVKPKKKKNYKTSGSCSIQKLVLMAVF
jgi:hypothetical protein